MQPPLETLKRSPELARHCISHTCHSTAFHVLSTWIAEPQQAGRHCRVAVKPHCCCCAPGAQIDTHVHMHMVRTREHLSCSQSWVSVKRGRNTTQTNINPPTTTQTTTTSVYNPKHQNKCVSSVLTHLPWCHSMTSCISDLKYQIDNSSDVYQNDLTHIPIHFQSQRGVS